MKRPLLSILLTLMFGLSVSAQTQLGYVKTKGRMENGKLVPGQGLKGARVSLQGRTTVLVNSENGAFSFPTPNQQFQIDSVNKKGYQLVDATSCPRKYEQSSNPIYIVMETPERQLQDKLSAERRIRRNLQKQLQEKEDEIEALKAQQIISEEEYRTNLQKLYEDQESNERLIADMAKRYSELDYDQLDEFYRQVSYYIENSELVKADSLLNTRGDITEQVANIKRREQALQMEKELLQTAEAFQKAEIEEAARRCYSYYQSFRSKHLNDTAAYYLELRTSLDTTNAEWLDETAEFATGFLADYGKALELLNKALKIRLSSLGKNNPAVATSYSNIGAVYNNLGDYEKAMEYNDKALEIRLSVLGENHPDVAVCYNNLGTLYAERGYFDKALTYFEKALGIWKSVYGEHHPEVATSYSNIGVLYSKQGKDEKALEYYMKSLGIRLPLLGENHPNVAVSYNNIGFIYGKKGDYEKALEYFEKALRIRLSLLGENHPDVAVSYNNFGFVYGKQGDLEKALENHNKALKISLSVFGENHPDVGTNYNNVGVIYYKQGNTEKALEYLNNALKNKLSVYGENHLEVATSYNNIGAVYMNQGDYDNALKAFNKALNIYESVAGKRHPFTARQKERIAEIQAKMKEQENETKE